MKILLDTHILLWIATDAPHLSRQTRALINNPEHQLFFSAASIWEVVIKRQLERADFQINPQVLRRGLLDNGYSELPISGSHTLAVAILPLLHKDPFDRILLAQAMQEGLSLLTNDAIMVQYQSLVSLIMLDSLT